MTMATDNIPSFITAQLNYLISHFPLTLKYFHCRVALLKIFDSLTFIGDVTHNVECPTAAPDVSFGPEDKDLHLFHMVRAEEHAGIMSSNNSLKDWNNKDPTRLLALIQYLRDHDTSYQRKRVGEIDDDQLKFDVNTILSREEIEMHMICGAKKEVKIDVTLMDMNINRMVPGPCRHSLKTYLQVMYPVGRNYASTPSAPCLKLVCTIELKALFSVDNVKLPPWLYGMCMAEYLPYLEESLEKQVWEANIFIDVRRQFNEALACQFGRPVEVDWAFVLYIWSQIARTAWFLLHLEFSHSWTL